MKRLTLVSALVLSLVLPGSASGAPAVIKATQFDDWSPFKTVITKGGKVVWKNPTTDGHHELKSYKGPSNISGGWLPLKALHPGATYKKTFKKKGRFYFRCPIHSTLVDGECGGMCGFVKVRAPS